MSRRHELIAVFEEARRLALLPDNDFSWSGWSDADEAVAAIERVLDRLRQNVTINNISMGIFFLPTGPLQELSISSGWGDEFIALADRFDAANAMPDEQPNLACACRVIASNDLTLTQDLGMTEDFSEITLLRCPLCNQLWLRYFHENEAFSNCGRWYLGAITEGQSTRLQASEAKALLASLPFYFCGGSYYGGIVGKRSGPFE